MSTKDQEPIYCPVVQEKHYQLPIENAKILSLDTDVFGNYIALSTNHEIITSFSRFKIDKKYNFPIIRWLSDHTFLVANCRANQPINISIFDLEGKEVLSFLAGDGIEDIVVVDDKIIITYFDEGVFGDEGPNQEGVAIFSLEGKLLYGFNSSGNDGFVSDCYAVCKYDNTHILFYSYTDFPLIKLNTQTFDCESYKTPSDFVGSHSMVCKRGDVFFHGSYDDKKSFFKWNIKQNKLTRFGSFSGHLRGLEEGAFVHVGQNEFTIITLE